MQYFRSIPFCGLMFFFFGAEKQRGKEQVCQRAMSTTSCRVRVFGAVDADVAPRDWVHVPEASLQGVGLPAGCSVRARTGSITRCITCEVDPPAGSDFDVVSWLGADTTRGDDLLRRCAASIGGEGTTAAAYVWGRCPEISSSQALSTSSLALVSVFQLAPGIDDVSGRRMADDMLQCVGMAQSEGYYQAGEVRFLFQSPTMQPFSLYRIGRNASWRVSEALKRHGFEVSSDSRTAKLRPNAAPVCVLVCSHGALYDRMSLNAAAVCRRLCATASSCHYGPLLSPHSLLVALGEDPDAPTRGIPQSAMERFEKVVRYYYELAVKTGQRVSLEALGLVDCEETRVLFGDLADPKRSQHGGLMWRVLKRVQILSEWKLPPASFARVVASGQVASASWPHSPATPVAFVRRGQFATEREFRSAVQQRMGKLLEKVHPDSVILYHGTSKESGLGILRSGVDYDRCISFSNFGRAFYTTPQFEYALEAALGCFPCVRTGWSVYNDGCALAFVFEAAMPQPLRQAMCVRQVTEENTRLFAVDESKSLKGRPLARLHREPVVVADGLLKPLHCRLRIPSRRCFRNFAQRCQ
jgi:hypothetical protein